MFRRVLLGAAIALAGCEARVLPAVDGVQEGTASGGGTSSGGGSGSGGGGNGSGGGITVPMPRNCETGPSPIRRLSRFELERTLQASFPGYDLPSLDLPDDQAPYGFDNDHDALRANSLWVEAQMEFAAEAARRAASQALSEVDCADLDDAVCASRFVDHWGGRLFRRPPTSQEVDQVAALFSGGVNREQGATLALQAMLSMPEFTYHIELPATDVDGPGTYPLSPESLAARLSYALWAAPPDQALVAAARAGELDDAEGLRAQAERMLQDPRARSGVDHFFAQWLDLGRLDRTSKLPEDGFDPALREAMKQETLRLVEALVFEREGSLEDLLTSPTTFLNADLAELYGVAVPDGGEEWFEATVPGRSGVLGHASFLASHSHPGNKSLVLRGTFILQRILCEPLGSPPPEAEGAMIPTDAELMTNRERYDALTMSSPDCAFCHEVINNAGYAYENYDTMGRFVTDENGVGIDATGNLMGSAYRDALELNAILGRDDAVVDCATENLLRYVFAGSPAGLDPCVMEDVAHQVGAEGGSLRELLLAVVSHPEFRTLRLDPQQ